MSDIGCPSIPVKSVLFKVPDNAIDISVTAQAIGPASIALPDTISYAMPVTTSGVAYTTSMLSSQYPSTQAEITSIGYVEGCRKVIGINIYPISVGTDGMSVTAYSQVKVSISYSLGSDTTIMQITPRRTSVLADGDNYLKANVENPLMVSASPIDADIMPLTSDQEEYDYIIITPKRFAKDFERLAAMRRTIGFGATVFPLEGLYIEDNAILNIVADGTVTLQTVHMGENATLNITAWNIDADKGWAINDGLYAYNFVCLGDQRPSRSSIRHAMPDYMPMVVEGRSWWQATEGFLTWWDRDVTYHCEVGFTIGSEVEVNGEKWHKLYISHYRDEVKFPYGIEWNEDESFIGYIREADRQVFVLIDYGDSN